MLRILNSCGEQQILALMARAVVVAVLTMLTVQCWFKPTEIEDNEVDSDDMERPSDREQNSRVVKSVVSSGKYPEETVDESEDARSVFEMLRSFQVQAKFYMEEMREMIGERKNNEVMKDMSRRLQIELENERELELLREMTSEREREIAIICKAAQDQWFGVIESCKHSVYVNHLDLRTKRKELEDHFASCGAVTTIEFCRDSANSRFIGMNSARIEFIDIPSKLKAMELAGTFLNGSKIDVTTVPAPGLVRYRGNRPRYKRFNYRCC
uniref:RRM domain-containing protein n=1 Tax=Setaria digitata TaxID=48799 RepID=A0A915PVE9_9BILA